MALTNTPGLRSDELAKSDYQKPESIGNLRIKKTVAVSDSLSRIKLHSNTDEQQVLDKEKSEYSSLYTKLLLEDLSIPTDKFIRIRVSELVNGTLIYLSKWIEYGTEDSYIYVNKIQELLSKYSKSLSRRGDTRILTGSLKLLIQDGAWEGYTEQQLRVFSKELERFSAGYIDYEALKTFHKQLFRAGITPFA